MQVHPFKGQLTFISQGYLTLECEEEILNILNQFTILFLLLLLLGMEDKWEEVFYFLSEGIYPSGYNKSKRLNLRRYTENFTLKGEYLKYIQM